MAKVNNSNVRILKTRDEFFDIMDKLVNGRYVTFGYILESDINISNETYGKGCNLLKFTDDCGLKKIPQAICKIKVFNIKYSSPKLSNQRYGQYVNSVNKIRKEFGIEPMQKVKPYKSTVEFGKGNASVYSGMNSEKEGEVYLPQNMYDVNEKNTKSVYYAVLRNGNVGKCLDPNVISKYIQAKTHTDSGVNALRKIGATEETIKRYLQRIKDLKMSYFVLKGSSLLWMAATLENGERILYLNTDINKIANDINVNPKSLVRIAKNEYKKALLKESFDNIDYIIEECIDKYIKKSVIF